MLREEICEHMIKECRQGIHTNSLASASTGARKCRLRRICIVTADRRDYLLDFGSIITADSGKV